MPSFSFVLRCCLLFLMILTAQTLSFSQPLKEEAEGNLPQYIEATLTNLIEATSSTKQYPSVSQLDTILQFVTSTTEQTHKILPATRDYGKGIFYKTTINTPLSTLIKYFVNPKIPGEALYPTSIRRNIWQEGSEILQNSSIFLTTPLPPQRPVFSRGTEYEEITPDISSGCYYSYILKRLFILYKFKNETVFITVSFMPKESSVGLRGGVIGKDTDWDYVYSPDVGTNLPMLAWAKTYIYGSATINIFTQKPNSPTTDIYMFKWTSAGWSGMNVVTHKHIRNGVIRFISGLKQIMESPYLPSEQEIIKKHSELNKMGLNELQSILKPFASELAIKSLKDSTLSKDSFQKILKNDVYPTTLTKENAVAELLKRYMKQKINQTVEEKTPTTSKK